MAKFILTLFAVLLGSLAIGQSFIKVNELYCTSDSIPLQGELSIYHPNGELSRVLHFEDGRLHQLALFYDENGRLTMSGSYFQNQRDGVWLTWDYKGTVTARAEFDQGEKIGEWIISGQHSDLTYRMYFANDKLLVARAEEN